METQIKEKMKNKMSRPMLERVTLCSSVDHIASSRIWKRAMLEHTIPCSSVAHIERMIRDSWKHTRAQASTLERGYDKYGKFVTSNQFLGKIVEHIKRIWMLFLALLQPLSNPNPCEEPWKHWR